MVDRHWRINPVVVRPQNARNDDETLDWLDKPNAIYSRVAAKAARASSIIES